MRSTKSAAAVENDRSTAYKNYLLVLITAIATFNIVDRLALGIVLQDIQAEFHLSDTQLGFLSGISFAFFYSVLGLPIARWADRGNRVTIISATTALWSIAVILCGFAASFFQLLFIRVFVGAGEAGCNPPAYSLIADYFTRAERPRATAIYGLGGALCTIPGYLGAGWLNEIYGWRAAFMVLGLPGVILAILAWLTMREPRLAAPIAAEPGLSAVTTTVPSLSLVVRTLWGNRTFRHLFLCLVVTNFFAYGLGQWHAPFFTRTYGMTAGRIGTALTITVCLGGLIGAYLVAKWTSRYAANDEQLQLRAAALAISISAIATIGVYTVPNTHVAFILLGVQTIGMNFMVLPLAAIQALVPRRMVAVSFALIFLCGNLIGAGLGPLATGILSDALRPLGSESLHYALLIFSSGYFWVAWHAWRASTTVTGDLQAMASMHEIADQTSHNCAAEFASDALLPSELL